MAVIIQGKKALIRQANQLLRTLMISLKCYVFFANFQGIQ